MPPENASTLETGLMQSKLQFGTTLATEPRTLLTQSLRYPAEVRRIAQLATSPDYVEAQHWFARERGWIIEQHLQLCRIPAPTFFEEERAGWFRGQLNSLGWRAKIDRAGNVLGTVAESTASPSIVISAHLDTVFAPSRSDDIYIASDGRLVGPGVSDNGSGLSALLGLARLFAENRSLHDLATRLVLVANVGEEGEGNLSGMRYLCRAAEGRPAELGRQPPELSKVFAFVVLDGPSIEHVTTQALASRRFEIAFSGPGGHSWNDYGTPNPVHAAGDLISHFVHSAETRMLAERKSRCSYNFGIIEGGTSINSIPTTARAKLDLRSEDPAILDDFAGLLSASVERSLERENRGSRSSRLSAKIKELGSRPGGKLPENSRLLRTVQSVDAYLNIRSRIDCASTDANVPLSLGLPAVSIGAGGQGGGAHTPIEWYQPEGCELGLRRILLLLAALSSELPDKGASEISLNE